MPSKCLCNKKFSHQYEYKYCDATLHSESALWTSTLGLFAAACVYATDNSTVKILDSTFIYNTGMDAGAVNLVESKLLVNNSNFGANFAFGHGEPVIRKS